ncbi:uncharacterized protein MELLADRAFT_91829 [Melampsora larici-populina 98AG31]|uniref:Uncharacterized protein n=1 Tax=Melampsora larici-populina (strain 98AG31 / pathotype 3-4-7) TaxID=747676 RepID=F4S0H1_MELLP|nr:uncharacterized protein MELLADRAFT_91829 [Melampsora larici-populina 98AG31]EGG01870.1 hypothetical protein MELLADRAFT_91829 [Melampsora larici-populina 98AG31]
MHLGWGLSDGEGLERIWSALSPLVSPNRYATKQHQLISLNLKAMHRNEILRRNAVRSTVSKLATAERTYDTAFNTLTRLEAERSVYTIGYFSDQWARQKQCQLAAMADGGVKKLEEVLSNLLDLEDKLKHAHNKLKRIRRKRRRHQTKTEREAILNLPSSIVALEVAIEEVTEELADPELQNLRIATGTSHDTICTHGIC